MKKMLIALLLFAGAATIPAAKAQVNIQVNINSQPDWGPTGYDRADFYYMPDLNCYYDISRAQFIYQQGAKWIYGKQLPGKYRNVNLYNTYKVVVNQPDPYRYNQTHINNYSRYKGAHNQPVIRDSRDARYAQNKRQDTHGQAPQNTRGHNGKTNNRQPGHEAPCR